MLPKFSYVRAQTLRDAFQHLSSEGARVHAGGTDLLGCLRDQVFDAAKVVSISEVGDLRGIAETRNGGLRIGALTTIAEVAANPVVTERYRALAQAASDVASPQLRNQGTIGGNICQKPRCWYYRGEFDCFRKGGTTCFAAAGENQYHCIMGGGACFVVHPSDTAPALLALGATVHIEGPRGTRTIPMDDFHVLPSTDITKETVLEANEIVTHIELPAPVSGLRSSYRKVRERGSWDFALAGVALALQFSNNRVSQGRVVFSGVAPVPWRSREVEAVISGQQLTAATAARASQAAVQNARPLTHNGYKVPLLRGLIEQELLAIREA
jgi:xanthine dehydrogenase YagS FAD-binding subunit